MARELFEKHSAYTRNALVAASAIFKDGDFRQPEHLYKIVKESLERGRELAIQKEQRMGMADWKSQIAKRKESGSLRKEHVKTKVMGCREDREKVN